MCLYAIYVTDELAHHASISRFRLTEEVGATTDERFCFFVDLEFTAS